VATAVQRRFDVRNSPSFAAAVRHAGRLAGRRLTRDGVLVINRAAPSHPGRNREDALARLVE